MAKMTTYMPKVITRPKTKSQRFRGVIASLLGMVWWGVSYSCATQIHFCNAGVETNGEVYKATVNDVLPSQEETVFADKDEWCFQQDSAPAQKAKKMQK